MKKELIKEKTAVLDAAITSLKKDFYGMDATIDKLYHIIKPSFVYGMNKEKPLIINLYGMTGTGKTDLIRKLLGYLKIKNTYIDSRTFVEESVKNIPKGSAIIMDEVQHIRTIDHRGDPLKNIDMNRSLHLYWRMMNGDMKIDLKRFIISMLHACIEEKRNNKSNNDYRCVVYRFNYNYRNHKEDFEIRQLYDKYEDVMSQIHEYIVQNKDLLENQPISDIFTAIYDNMGNFKFSEDQTDVMIFNLGNIDGVVSSMVSDLEFLDQNEIAEKTEKITNNDCREALLKMFRPEEVSRFGDNFIFMPAINHKSLVSLLNSKLDKIKDDFKEKLDTQIDLDESVSQYIIDNYNIPSQGLRPIMAALAKIITAPLTQNIDFIYESKITLAVENDNLIIKKDKFENVIHPLPILKVEEPSADSIKRTALHEAGHAVIYNTLFNKIPVLATLKTRSSSVQGYVKMDPEEVLTKGSIKNSIQVSLAGYLVEELIYSPEGVSEGSSSDLINATKLGRYYVNQFGFGKNLIYHDPSSFRPLFASFEEKNDVEIAELLDQAKKDCMKLINDNKEKIENFAKLLIEKKVLNKEELTTYFTNKHT